MTHLSTHYAEGRLNNSEFDARCTSAAEATTTEQLLPLFNDLPGGLPLDEHGQLQENPIPPTRESHEDQYHALKKRGETIENLDWIIVGLTLLAFLGLRIADVQQAWLVWPSLIVTLSVPRLIMRFSDEDEANYEELQEAEREEFQEKLREARRNRRLE